MSEYSMPVLMTQQFRFCPNPFRIDMYRGCDFGCRYCFSTTNNRAGYLGFTEASIDTVKKLFYNAFESDKKSNDITVELLQHRVPLHCGGVSDPFQKREFCKHLTYQMIQVANEYDYPILFSTKVASLPDDYYKVLRPDIHAFHSSIMGWTESFIRKYEVNTPTAQDRLEFGKQLRQRGFWWGIRIQPLIDMDEAKQLISNAGEIPNYITVEHLKITTDNERVTKLFMSEYQDSKFHRPNYNLRNLEVTTAVKKAHIEELQKLANSFNVPVGVGDNDLHYMSQSRCCCGVDIINDNFSNYLKYNLTYMSTGDADTEDFSQLYCPCSNCRVCFNSDTVKNEGKFVSFKKMVDDYINKNDDCISDKYKPNIHKQLFGVIRKKLF